MASGGYSSNLGILGADQLKKSKDRDVFFFNWYFMVRYASAIVSSTAIVYVQDNVSWTLGFALAIVSGIIGMVALISGTKYYRRRMPEGSPLTGLARVVVAALRKRGIVTPTSDSMQCYYAAGEDPNETSCKTPTQTLRFLNRAAVVSEGDVNPYGSISRPWRLCTVRQVEDMKALVNILPLWSSSIFLSISISIQVSFTVLQALAMDRSLGPGFAVPAASMVVSSRVAFLLSLFALDRVFYPLWSRLAGGRCQTPLQRIGLGHVINVVAMAVNALVERRREGLVREHGAEGHPDWVAPMSAMWLVLPLLLIGLGEALHVPGQVALYYQEFPRALRSTSSAMMGLSMALGFYLSTTVVDLFRNTTSWLPDNINASRMENVFWMLTAMTAINFGYYYVCAQLYEYRSSDDEGP